MKTIIAIRNTNKGFRLCEISIVKSNYGGFRKYSSDSNLVYKRASYAEAQCKDFYKRCGYDIHYFGIIPNDAFHGEPATEIEFESFNSLSLQSNTISKNQIFN